jgi:hypothetical protein
MDQVQLQQRFDYAAKCELARDGKTVTTIATGEVAFTGSINGAKKFVRKSGKKSINKK